MITSHFCKKSSFSTENFQAAASVIPLPTWWILMQIETNWTKLVWRIIFGRACLHRSLKSPIVKTFHQKHLPPCHCGKKFINLVKVLIFFTLNWINLKLNQYKTYKDGGLCHWSLSASSENIRKPLVFWCFKGMQIKTTDMKWIQI